MIYLFCLLQVAKILEDGGASISKFMDFITHLVCGNNYDENDITQAAELYDVPSVTEAWVLASARLGRLASTKAYFPLKSALFTNLTFAAIQLDNRDLKKLYGIITFHGGTLRNLFDRQTTHLICGIAKGSIYTKALGIAGVILVTPDWAIECLKANSLIACEPYHPRLVITPRIFKQATQRPETPVQKSEPEKPLASIIGFDFEENLVKTEVPTCAVGKKSDGAAAPTVQQIAGQVEETQKSTSPPAQTTATLQHQVQTATSSPRLTRPPGPLPQQQPQQTTIRPSGSTNQPTQQQQQIQVQNQQIQQQQTQFQQQQPPALQQQQQPQQQQQQQFQKVGGDRISLLRMILERSAYPTFRH